MKNGKGQIAEKNDVGGNTRKGESSFPKQKGKFEECSTCGGPHLKRDYPAQVKVNARLSAGLDKEINNDAEMTKVNSLEIVKDKDVGHDMILVRNSNRLR